MLRIFVQTISRDFHFVDALQRLLAGFLNIILVLLLERVGDLRFENLKTILGLRMGQAIGLWINYNRNMLFQSVVGMILTQVIILETAFRPLLHHLLRLLSLKKRRASRRRRRIRRKGKRRRS